MEWLTERRQEFIAKTFSDMGKAIFTVGIATFFFRGLPAIYRLGCMTVSAILIIVSIFIHPK